MAHYVKGMFTAETKERIAVNVNVPESALTYMLALPQFEKAGINGLADELAEALKRVGFMWQASGYGGGYGMQISAIAPDGMTADGAKEHALATLRWYVETL